MGLRYDLDRYREVGEDRREDLSDFIKHGDLGQSHPDRIRIPIKIVSLPEFVYDRLDMGGVGISGEGKPDIGKPIGKPRPSDESGSGEAGMGGESHEYYEMEPEEFAEELEREFDLELEPKGKKVLEEEEGDLRDIVRSGPMSTLHFKRMFKEGLKRQLASNFNPDLLREVLKVEDMTPDKAFTWARNQNMNVSREWVVKTYEALSDEELGSVESIEEAVRIAGDPTGLSGNPGNGVPVQFRKEDERYRYPEIELKRESKVVVVNIRDVSGSMGKEKRELVERTFTPLDWYLQGKYSEADFVYIAHDVDAWMVKREDFFGIQSGGGTRISSAYELAEQVLEERYPWSEWNRYVFAAGDGENSTNDTKKKVIPLMDEVDSNLHAYVETQPSGDSVNATHADELEEIFGSSMDVVVTRINSRDDVMDGIHQVLLAAAGEGGD